VKGRYDPGKAAQKAYVRRRCAKFQGKKIVSHDGLREFVEEALRDDLSPAAISGRLRFHESRLPSVSKDSIYRFLKSPYGRKIEYERLQKGRHRRRRRTKTSMLSNRKFIDERPKSIDARRRTGDAEGDFIVSGKTGQGILLVITDRKTRAAFLESIGTVTVKAVHRAALRIKKRFPEWRTMTTDNDILFKRHQELEKLLKIRIYFCHPYHSWEKGTVENTNKHIRKDIPKGSDIFRYPKKFIRSVENKLNRRPLRCLHYFTPAEMLRKYRIRKKDRKTRCSD
jgi:IS30 family transposase